MKKFIVKVTVYLVLVVLICFVPSIVVDPFNVFHPLQIRDTGVEPNKNYIKTTYILDSPDKFDSFLMGSSHVAVMNVYKLPNNCYNMYYSGAVPEETTKTLETFVENGIVPRHVYLGVDVLSYASNYDNHLKERLRVPYQYSETNPLDFWMLYLDPVVNLKASIEVVSNPGNNIFEPSVYSDIFYENGGQLAYGVSTSLDKEEYDAKVSETYESLLNTLSAEGKSYQDSSLYMDSQLQAIAEMKALCDEKGIELTVFVNPMFFLQFAEAVEEQSFLRFLYQLAEITDYYNFSGFNVYTTDCTYYYEDCSHYFCELGDIVIDVLQDVEPDVTAYSQGFGMHVTEENVEEFLHLLINPDSVYCNPK